MRQNIKTNRQPVAFSASHLCLLFLIIFTINQANGEIYISLGADGERLISDRPPHNSENYRLILQRDNIENIGHGVANHPANNLSSNLFGFYIEGASLLFNVDPTLIEAVIQIESGFNPNAVSSQGATGLMQLMQKTAQQYHVADRFNPRQNIYAGVEHLSKLIDRYNGELPLVLAAYNAGDTAVRHYQGVPPYPETRRYIKKVMDHIRQSNSKM